MLDLDNLSTNGLLVIYVLFLSVFVQEQAGHPDGSQSDWYHGIMLIDFMVAYPGRRDEVQMRFTNAGQSQPAWTYFISWPTPLCSPHEPPSTYTPCRLKQAKGRAPLGVNYHPRMSPIVLFLCLMANAEVSGPRPAFSRKLSMTVVLWHGRFAGWGVTCSARLSLGLCRGFV